MQVAIVCQRFHKLAVRIHENGNDPRTSREPIQQAAQGAGRDVAWGSLVQHKSQVIRPRVHGHTGIGEIGQSADFDFGFMIHDFDAVFACSGVSMWQNEGKHFLPQMNTDRHE